MPARTEDWIDTPGLDYVLQKLVPEAAEAAKSGLPVLISGPSGVGKSHIAARIIKVVSETCTKELNADTGEGRRQPRIKVHQENCAALHRGLLESELFGHKKGAFTGATNEEKGLIEENDILMLDEIGTLPKYLQAKLLTFLDTGDIRRIGCSKAIKTKTKILAASNTPLDKGVFREDFLYRFHIITVPGLHARRFDIPYLLRRFAPGVKWSSWDLLQLMAHHWPGNVRQLRRFAELAQKYCAHDQPASRTLWAGVLHWFRKDRFAFCEAFNGLSVKTRGVPERESEIGLPNFLFEKTWIEKVAEFCPNLLFDTHGNLRNLKELDTADEVRPSGAVKQEYPDLQDLLVDQRAEQLNSEVKEIQKREYNFHLEWQWWCELFSQDPQYDGDLLDCIASGKCMRPTLYPTNFSGSEDDEALRSRFDELKSSLIKKLYPDAGTAAYQAQTGVYAVNDLKEDEAKESELEKALTLVLDNVGYKEYEKKWMEHCEGLKPSEIAEKYGVNRKTMCTKQSRQKKTKRD